MKCSYGFLNTGGHDLFDLPHRFESRRGMISRELFLDNKREARRWCEERWGPKGTDNIAAFRYTFWGNEDISWVVLVRDPDDAFEFRMRWS